MIRFIVPYFHGGKYHPVVEIHLANTQDQKQKHHLLLPTMQKCSRKDQSLQGILMGEPKATHHQLVLALFMKKFILVPKDKGDTTFNSPIQELQST